MGARRALSHRKPLFLRRRAPKRSATMLTKSTLMRMCHIALLASYADAADKRAAANYIAQHCRESVAIYYRRIAAMTDEQIEAGALDAVLEALFKSHGYDLSPED
jgi:hypothetical protein